MFHLILVMTLSACGSCITSDKQPQACFSMQNFDVEGNYDITRKISFPPIPSDVVISFSAINRTQMGFAEKFGIVISNKHGEFVRIGYDNFNEMFFVDCTNDENEKISVASYKGVNILNILPHVIDEPEMDIRVIFDVTSLEMFAMNGKSVFTETFYPFSNFNKIEIFAENGKILFNELTICQVKTIEN